MSRQRQQAKRALRVDLADELDECLEHRWDACATCASGCYICLDCGAEELEDDDEDDAP